MESEQHLSVSGDPQTTSGNEERVASTTIIEGSFRYVQERLQRLLSRRGQGVPSKPSQELQEESPSFTPLPPEGFIFPNVLRSPSRRQSSWRFLFPHLRQGSKDHSPRPNK